jgi:DNA topoisomerase-6 subunit B
MKILADELFKEFREHSVSEFFRKNAAMLGYTGKIRSLTTVVHEGVTNAIDAAEESNVLPTLSVTIKKVDENPEHFKVVIEDNASGIPEEFIPNVFGKMLAGTKLHRNMQSRGQQGIGIVGGVMFSQITSGRPTSVITSVGAGEIVQADVMINVDKNEGKIVNGKKLKGHWRGTRVELELKDVAYVRSRYGPFNYLRMTAIANPHARITFTEPDGMLTVFERATDKVPNRPKLMPPHPWGIASDDLLILAKRAKSRTIASFMVAELSRTTKRKVEEIRKISGVNLNRKPSELNWEDAEKIVSAFKQVKFMAPPTEGLRPIGAEDIEKGMRQILKPEFVYAVTRSPRVYRGGIPFIVEASVAYGGSAGKAASAENGGAETEGLELIRFANRAPLIFDQGGCAITSAVRNIDWRRYGVDISTAPLTLFVNVVSAYVPYTSAGKQSIAEEPEVYEEIRATIMDAARELRRYLYRKIRVKEKQIRAGVFEQYLPIIARRAASLAGVKAPDVKALLKKVAGDKNAES